MCAVDVCRQDEEAAPENANLTEKTAFYIRQFQVTLWVTFMNLQ